MYRTTERDGTVTLFKNKYRIESTRLPGWDYASAGVYFVTICTKNRECFFGEIIAQEVHLSPIGEIACQNWQEIPQHSRGKIELDEFVIMPNHVHGIIVINAPPARRDLAVGADHSPVRPAMSIISPKAGSLGAILRSYKSSVSRACGINGYSSFCWQERYFDEIIWNEDSLMAVRTYIAQNPANWDRDRDNLVGLRM